MGRARFLLGIFLSFSSRHSNLGRVPSFNLMVFAGSSPITSTSPSSKAHQKSGPFAPPALPGLNGSYDPVRLPSEPPPSATLRPLPSHQTRLSPSLRGNLSRGTRNGPRPIHSFARRDRCPRVRGDLFRPAGRKVSTLSPMIHAYARVSTEGQSIATQVKQLRSAGAEKVWRETASGEGRAYNRPTRRRSGHPTFRNGSNSESAQS
jgi:hypothetical protein